MKRFGILYIVIIAVFLSCTDRDDNLDSINIRIKNDSDILFNEVQIGDNEEVYENVESNSYSDYLIYVEGFTANTIYITAGEETYRFTPENMDGEMELPIGLYTYKLNLNAEGEVLFEFVID
ncbi:hypothetical protein [Eudoraea chungangensis]|uniref:hypothetical protein n=1 Tax=Eudoraea chungangensis TaxID=1481905 RepID=UPI0023EC58D1|nr:hypothetical protein [Eudoraea chungangensis]